MLQFLLSATPFYCGLWGIVSSHRMPSFTHKFLNSFDTYSPPLSLLSAFTFLLVYFSTNALNSMNFENVWSFFHMKKIQHFLEKSSIKMKKYFYLAVEAINKGPQTLERILSKFACTLLSQSWNLDFVYFPEVHPLNTYFRSIYPLVRPLVICCIILKVPWWKWPSILCTNSPTSWPYTFLSLVLNVTQSFTSSLYKVFTWTLICFTYPMVVSQEFFSFVEDNIITMVFQNYNINDIFL